MELFTKVLELEPLNTIAHFNLFLIKSELNDIPKADFHIIKAIKLFVVSKWDYFLSYAQYLYLKKGENDLSDAFFSKSTKLTTFPFFSSL